MKLKRNQFLAIVYSDLFSYPLTKEEVEKWQIGADFGAAERDYVSYVEESGGYWFLKGRGKIVRRRKQREKWSGEKKEKIEGLVKKLKQIPTIAGIFLTGSVAAGNAERDADWDLMVVAEPGTVWLTRTVVVLVLKIAGIYRSGKSFNNKVCTNMYLDRNYLEVPRKNLYTAEEICRAECLFDRGGVEQEWLRANKWISDYLPRAKNISGKKEKRKGGALRGLDFMIFRISYLLMKRKMTREEVSLERAFFHPRELSGEIEEKFKKKLREVKVV